MCVLCFKKAVGLVTVRFFVYICCGVYSVSERGELFKIFTARGMYVEMLMLGSREEIKRICIRSKFMQFSTELLAVDFRGEELVRTIPNILSRDRNFAPVKDVALSVSTVSGTVFSQR